MATTAKIAITNADKTLTSIYLHWDGYLEHAGEILPTHYDTEVKARELIELGDLNSLDKTIACCCFEHRDRAADWDDCQPTTYRSFANFMENRSDADYLYIYQDGKWYYHTDNKTNKEELL